jgi:hypothetical protein
MNLYAFLKQQESYLDEPFSSPVRWTAGERIDALNRAALRMNTDMSIIYNIGSDSTVAYQQDYSLPKGQDSLFHIFDNMLNVIYQPNIGHYRLIADNIKSFMGFRQISGIPSKYIVYPRDQKIKFLPIPSASAQTTALSADATATATTLTVLSTSGFGIPGRVKIDSEVISYTNTTPTTFTGCVRGEEGTTATTHNGTSSPATVTWRDLLYHYLQHPQKFIRVYSTGTITTTNGSTAVSGNSTAWLNNVKPGDFIGSGVNTPDHPERYYEIASVTSDTALVLVEPWRELAVAGAVYGAGQPSEFPDEYDEGVIYLSCHFLFQKDDDPKKDMMLKMYEQFRDERSAGSIPSDYVPILGRGNYRRTAVLGTMPSGYPNV